MAVTGRYLFTQPETLLAIITVVVMYFLSHLDSASMNDVILRFVHLTSFSLYVGMSFWMTFVAGLTMFKILPRNLFSAVQSVLFAKYVAYCVLFSIIALGSYYMQVKATEGFLSKILGLLICVGGSLVGCAVFPLLSSKLAERNQIEKDENIGRGIGNDNEPCKKLKETNSTYAAIYTRVVWLHGLSALTNLICLVGMTVHLATLSYNVTFH
ncbi:transmembrane protein 205-like [Watersipora subatra]|uniref:transmembrane protein 205-like n=1 Tax=Watersipora subatra TaxID=2589382 RepID=UPI00355B0DF5